MEAAEIYVDVVLPLALPRLLTYCFPAALGEARVGMRVLVPLGKHKRYTGIVRRVHHQCPENYQVKEVLQLLDETPVVNECQLAFWEWMSAYYLSTEGEVMTAALPSGLKVEGDESEVKEKYVPRTESYIVLAEKYREQEDALVPVFDALEKDSRLHRQLDTLLAYISLSQRIQQPMVPKRLLLEAETSGESSLKQLIKKKVLCQEEVEVSRLASVVSEKTVESIALTPAQQRAKDELDIQFAHFSTVLLHGVTGSGKTEIYIKYIKEVLATGKQVLYLLPEIALTTQIITRLQRYFGNKVGVYHSRFSEQERVEIWKRVQAEDDSAYQVVIGARSSLFLPFRQLGLIIVDEEHDASFKQYDPSPRYHARDAAIVLAQMHQARVLLGSATPSLESTANVHRGKYGLVKLDERYAGMELPQVQLVNLKQTPRSPLGMSPYSKELLDGIAAALKGKEQVILFQNRRGFSPHLECGECHYIPLCRHCDVAMTYHKDMHQLRCHYCGYTENLPHECPQCGSPKMQMKGFGTEKVEEELMQFFPDARIARLDYDTTRSRTAYQKIISDFELQKIQILVGTQMVTKGLDFDNVSLVGILNADNLLYYPEFRAYERAFQVLSQVSGRAGRKHHQGKVIIQTFNPVHPVFGWVCSGNYEEMYHQVMEERRQFLYPPYCRFIQLTFKSRNIQTLDAATAVMARLMRQQFGNMVLGPAYPSIQRIKNLYMKQVLLKVTEVTQLPAIKQWLRQAADAVLADADYRSVFVSFDVDPY